MRTFTSLSTKVYYINVGIALFISSQLYYSMVLYIFVVSKYESVSNYEKKVWTVIVNSSTNIKFKFKFKMLLSLNNTVCESYTNYTNKHVTKRT
jgi:hypothetical protein